MAPEELPPTLVSAQRPALRPDTKGLAVMGRIARADVAALCDRARRLLETCDSEVIVCDVGAIVDPDLGTVDALARIQLTARRQGRGIYFSRASRELKNLLALTGLSDVVPLYAGSAVEPRGQSEEREELLGIEEKADPGDLPA